MIMESQNMRQLTEGEQRLRINLDDPVGTLDHSSFKADVAILMDKLCSVNESEIDPRCKAIALTKLEEASMFITKAVTG